MNPDILTLPQYSKQQGYETTGTGKIYDPRCVDAQFDAVSWSIPFEQIAQHTYFSEGIPMPAGNFQGQPVRAEKKAYAVAFAKFPMVKPITEYLDLPDDAYDDGAFANCAMEQMEMLAKGDKPFFLAVGLKKPHLPFVAPKNYWDLYDRSKIELAPFQQMPKGLPNMLFRIYGNCGRGIRGSRPARCPRSNNAK